MAVYTTIDDPSAYFQLVSWTGNGTDGRTITLPGSTDMRPDFIWVKNRTDSEDHCLMDVVRTFASGKALRSNGGDEEGGVGTAARGWVEAASDGFTCEDGSSNANLVNASSDTYLAWCWKAGGSGSSNSDGAIATTRSVSTTAGFSIMKYTGSGSGSNIAHGLGATPEITIRKNTGGVQDWNVHTTVIDGSHDYLILNTTAAKANSSLTAPSSTLVYTAADSATFIVYAFKSIQGFSKFGSYTGNGNADGAFIYTGFRPAFIITKRTSSTGDWLMYDNKREGYNVDNDYLKANATSAEQADVDIDIVSNGFKIRNTAADQNANGGTYIYAAFAEAPFVNSNGVPCTAR